MIVLPQKSEQLLVCRPLIWALLASQVLAGCSLFETRPKKDVTYRHERFAPDSPYEMSFEVAPAKVCDAGRRALLSQGYVIDEHKTESVRATKFFQPERTTQVQITFSLSCLKEGEEGAQVFANAREARSELKSSSSSAGVSVAGVGSVNLPLGASGETLVKVGEETIADADFYGRFFALLQTYVR